MADAIFFGAHPDDVEILAGGLVAKFSAEGREIVVADATAGEMGSRGTPEERAREAADAAAIFGCKRINLGLPDGRIAEDIPAATRAAVMALREHRPRLVFVHEPDDHHPDHNALSRAVKYAFFQANVLKYDTGQERFKPSRLFFYVGSRHRWPRPASFVVDVTAHWPTKLAALRAHRSQFANEDYDGPATFISSPEAWDMIETRAKFFGSLVDAKYGEPVFSEAPLRVDDVFGLIA